MIGHGKALVHPTKDRSNPRIPAQVRPPEGNTTFHHPKARKTSTETNNNTKEPNPNNRKRRSSPPETPTSGKCSTGATTTSKRIAPNEGRGHPHARVCHKWGIDSNFVLGQICFGWAHFRMVETKIGTKKEFSDPPRAPFMNLGHASISDSSKSGGAVPFLTL